MNYDFVQRQSDLDAVIAKFANAPSLALDTEFVRVKTYRAQLGLLQFSDHASATLIDPLAVETRRWLTQRLNDESQLKILHSASEDLEVFWEFCSAIPRPYFDTQIGACFAGVGAGLGYQKLILATLGIALDKSETRSDWLARPLSEAQLAYAAADVHHLHAVHDKLQTILQENGRYDWVLQEGARLASKTIDPDRYAQPHQKFKLAWQLDEPRQRALWRILRWRETEAARKNLPRSWVLDNGIAYEIALKMPQDLAGILPELKSIRRDPERLAQSLLAMIHGQTSDEIDVFELVEPPPKGDLRTSCDQLRIRLDEVANALNIPGDMLSNRRTLEQFVQSKQWPAEWNGWRQVLIEAVI
jgi:ribonuclease D